MAKPKYVRKPPKRFKKQRARVWLFDFRGIQTSPPNKEQLQLLKRVNRSYRGKKPAFSSPQQLQAEVDQYFESCYGPLIDQKKNELVYDKNGEVVRVQVEPFTVSGLAYYIGVPTEVLDKITWGWFDNLDDTTEEDELYSAILKRAKQRINLYAEKRLYDRDGVVGAKFVLDHHFKMIGQREAAEIEALRKQSEYKMQELELKKQMLDVDDEDSSLQITIVRKDD